MPFSLWQKPWSIPSMGAIAAETPVIQHESEDLGRSVLSERVLDIGWSANLSAARSGYQGANALLPKFQFLSNN
ncbi:hypothetical protein ACFOGI_10215 [Virgibacillus xinjiangensis]|uniref:Uncharacterized protein n=1 Tax=Virgibacillus xinjiangensis TaxID=393090 RepID=A0ABV7CWI1_9BACI